ncbi:MAG: DUF362 domain-containing protein [Nanoarchaeota archaeon]|nr:DUF362 domain-containing protein [Nanoarchaeota archaeon]MBU1270244.1 DUF362 domain-containing protein [Nanoarchaeota archaeon]MBU1603677.1 DUF362 domain-containing protein [Nanoarchaeota archaeon]MBU2443734.1 DUF362 domain-containing protein [Nanoarchaeota archaeon]
MVKVYYTPINSENRKQMSLAAKKLLLKLIDEENIKLEKEVPLKVHFGEKGNKTFIKPENFQGIIDLLKERKVKSSYIETNVLYRGARMKKDEHIKLALKHGFTQLPIIIADGEQGELSTEVEINQKHIKNAKIGSEFLKYKQIIVISHFKGHMLAGFGGAIKQLAMGFASRAGKLDAHANAHPTLNPLKCSKCKTCQEHCPANAITIGFLSRINTKKCIGCAECIARCQTGAITINWASTMPNKFRKKLVEYALAAAKDKKNIYITFAIDITKHCDCMNIDMKPVIKNIGILASTNPVAIDAAAYDLAKKKGKKFSGKKQLEYAEEIGLGRKEYELETII